MRTAAILPVKRFARAKQRLGQSIPDPLRLALAEAMVADVLSALARTRAIERTILVTSEPTVAATAREHGAVVVQDTAESGQSAAVAIGVAWAMSEGIERVLCVPGDCPALDPDELATLLRVEAADAAGPSIAIVPDRHGTGTNGLLLSPPDAIAPSFGPDSCERHRELARAARCSPRLAHPSSLLLDVDTGADLAVLRERLAGLSGRAAHTRAVLDRDERPHLSPLVSAV